MKRRGTREREMLICVFCQKNARGSIGRTWRSGATMPDYRVKNIYGHLLHYVNLPSYLPFCLSLCLSFYLTFLFAVSIYHPTGSSSQCEVRDCQIVAFTCLRSRFLKHSFRSCKGLQRKFTGVQDDGEFV